MRLRELLTPRRKYEVDESMKLVKFGRSRVIPVVNSTRRVLAPAEKEMIMLGRHLSVAAGVQLHRAILLVQWGRMPKPWELSFVSKMKEAESQGIPFPEVLQTGLPLILGEAPSEVLLRWVGRKARSQPKHFAKVVEKMFGPSGKRVITGLQERFNPNDRLGAHEEPEEPFQALIDSIEKAEVARSGPPRYLDKNRWKNFSA
jgi:hypothetical protein